MKELIKRLFTFENSVTFELRDDQIQKIVDTTFDKFKDLLPSSKCWQCQKIAKPRSVWMDKFFCSEECFKEHARVIGRPDQDYKIVNGEKVGEFTK